MSNLRIGLAKFGLVFFGALALLGLSACADEEAPVAQVSEAEQAEKSAPAPQGAPVFTVYFDLDLLDQSEAARRDHMWLPPGNRGDVAAIANQAKDNPNKTILITTYFDDTQHEVNDANYARLRGNAVRNAIAGEGLPDARIASNAPVRITGGSGRDANRVEVRLQ